MNAAAEPPDAAAGPPRALIFDLDGVLVDSEPVHWRVSRRLFGGGLTMEEYAPFIGLAIEPYMAWARERFGLAEPAAALGERYAAAVAAELEACAPPPLDGARELIGTARGRGIAVAVASQSPGRWVRPTLRGAGLGTAFAAVVTGGGGERPKPAPDLYLRAAALLGEAPAACVAIEDSPAGVASAAAAGMAVVQSRQASTAAPPQPGADLVVASLREIALDRLPRR